MMEIHLLELHSASNLALHPTTLFQASSVKFSPCFYNILTIPKEGIFQTLSTLFEELRRLNKSGKDWVGFHFSGTIYDLNAIYKYREEAEFLCAEGLLYSTLDDNHFKLTGGN